MAESKITFKGDTSSVDRALNKIKADTAKVGKSMQSSLTNSLSSVTKGLGDISSMSASASTSITSMGSGLAKLGPYGAIAAAAIASIGAGIANSQALTDMFAKKWEQIKSILSVVGKAMGELFQGKFEDFMDTIKNGFTESWGAAGKYADVLDAVETNTITWGQQQARLNQQMAEQRAIIADTTKSTKERKQAQKELMQLNEEYGKVANKQANLQSQLADAYIDKLLAESGQAQRFNESEKARLKDYLTATNGTIDDMQALGGKWASVFDKISDSEYRSFATMYTNAQTTMQSISDTVKTNLKAIQKDVTEKPIAVKAEIKPNEIVFPEGSIGAIRKKIDELSKKQLSMVFHSAEWEDAERAKQELEAQIKDTEPIEIEAKFSEGTIGAIKQQIAELNKELEYTAYGSDAYNSLTEQINKLNESIGSTKNNLADTSNNAQGVASMFGSASGALSEFAGESREAAVAQKSLAIAEQMAAMASAISTASKGDPYTVAARIIATSGAIVAAFASMAKAKFAGGGIVGGSRYAGDTQIIRANSGEMVLNSSQQARLFNAISNGNLGSHQTTDISLVVKGDQLESAINNYNKKYNRMK